MLTRVFLAGLLFFLVQCNRQENSLTISVDMSSQHDEGNFTPELGDKLAFAGEINDWESSDLIFKDGDEDWVYELKIPPNKLNAVDTLEFKLVINSDQNRDLNNGGWETIVNRKIPKETFLVDETVLVFNEPWAQAKIEEVTFSVSMSNQRVLGFFNPSTDKVIVTGSFLGWDPEGVEMDDKDDDMIYEISMPVEINPIRPEAYKYRIIKKEKQSFGHLPNEGWEFIDNRLLAGENNSGIEVDYFNDQMRVARFQIARSWLSDTMNIDINKGDQIQIILRSNDHAFLSPPLVKVKKGIYETSIEIPLNMSNIEWQISKNYENQFKAYESLNISQMGAVIRK